MLTRTDYDTISTVLREVRMESKGKGARVAEQQIVDHVVDMLSIKLSYQFSLDNPRFNNTKFILATRQLPK